jgi:GntR family transcriptional regulator of arabinose operon
MKKGLPEPVFCASNEELIKVFRSKEDRPTALAAYSDKIAIEAKYLLRNIGLSIPEDVSLLGYDDIWACEIPDISLTSIAPRKIDIGAGAVKMLLRVMAGGQPESILVKPELHKRNSTAKPPGVK